MRSLHNHAAASSLSIFFLLACEHTSRAFVSPKTRTPRQSLTKRHVQIPAELSTLLQFGKEESSLLEGVSWSDVALYGGLPLAVLSFILSQPPARLLTDRELQDITEGTFLQQGRSKSSSPADVTCLYKASRDGWSALDFHDKVDNLGSAVVAARSLTGQIFGGYNPAGFRSTDDYIISTAAFLWAKKGSEIVKFPILPGGNAAVFDYATSGPNFGASDLAIGPPKGAVMGGFAGPDAEDISTNAGNLREAKSVSGITYDTTAAWPARGNLVLSEVEVYGRA